MAEIEQEQFTRIFENIGGALGGLKRYVDAANLIGGTSYFLFVKEDEFGAFPDPVDAFKKVKNLLRGIAYSGEDDILRMELTETTPGATFVLDIVEDFGGTVIATAAGIYGTEVTLVPQIALGPAGKIKVTGPLNLNGETAEIQIQVVASAARLSMDVTGETEEESLLEAAAVESHQVTASNFRAVLLEAARNRVVLDRLLQKLVGKFLGSDTETAFTETLIANSDGSVDSNVSGLLTELESLMIANTPEQTVQPVSATLESSTFSSKLGTEAGTIDITLLDPSAGSLILKCTRGFTVETPDPEEFEVRFNSESFSRSIVAALTARPFRQFNWLSGGFRFTIKRKTESEDPWNQMADPEISEATPTRIPLQYVNVRVYKDAAAVNQSLFEITEPQSGSLLYQATGTAGTDALADGHFDIKLSNSMEISFDWTNNPSLGSGFDLTFKVNIHPFRPGDQFIRRYSVTSGRLQLELRRNFDFAFRQTAGSPTIEDTVVPPDLPYVSSTLGA